MTYEEAAHAEWQKVKAAARVLDQAYQEFVAAPSEAATRALTLAVYRYQSTVICYPDAVDLLANSK